METSADIKTVNYRLDKIETTLSELKNVVLELRLQKKDIEILDEETKNNGRKIKSLTERVDKLEDGKMEDKAIKWDKIMDYVFKFVVTGVVAIVATKIGLKS